MKIEKTQWEQWASEYAENSMTDFAANVPLTLPQAAILKTKLEGAVMLGYDLVLRLQSEGFDVSEAGDCMPHLIKQDPKEAPPDAGS